MKECEICYAQVPDDASVCPECGAPMNVDAKPAEPKSEGTVCSKCGTKIAAGKKFCPECGAAVTDNAKPAEPAPVVKKPITVSGKIRQILPTVGIALTLLLTVIFMFVPALSLKASAMGQSTTTKQAGVTGLAVLFTGKSDMIAGGAKEIVMRLIGAGYIALLLALIWYILFAVSSVLKYDKNTAKHNIIMNAVLTVVSLVIMILTAMAKSQITKNMGGADDMAAALGIKTSWFMGGVALFVVNAIMLVYAIVMRVLYKPELDRNSLTPNLLGKKTRRALTVVDVLVVIVCIVVPIVTGCAGSNKGLGKSPDKAKELKSSDTVTVKCTEQIPSMTGATGYYNVGYLVYTPSRDGELTVELSVSGRGSESDNRGAYVAIEEYSDIQMLYSMGGNLAVFANTMDGSATDSCEVTVGEKYCVVIGGYSVTKDDKMSFSYNMTFESEGDGQTGGNGSSRSNAITLTLDNNVSTGTLSNGTGKWYKYTPATSGEYTIATSTVNADPDLRVYEGNSSSYIDSDSSSGGFEKTLRLTSGTTYYFEIYNSGSCTFSIVKESSDVPSQSDGSTRATAIALALDNDVTVDNLSNGKWYKYTPTESAQYAFVTSYYDSYLDLRIYAGDASSSFDGDSSSSGLEKTVSLTSGMTYYFQISGDGACAFSISKVTEGTSTSDAKIVALNTKTDVTLNGNNIYYFKFNPQKTGYYDISFRGNNGSYYVTDYVVSRSGSYVTPSAEYRYSGGATRIYSLTAGNDYFIRAYSLENGSSKTASIEITLGNYTSARANTIVFGDEYTVQTNSVGRYMSSSSSYYSGYYYFRYVPTAATNHIYAELKNGTSNDTIRLYSASGSSDSPTLTDVTSVYGNSALDRTLTVGTTYYIRVYKYSSQGSATFTIRDGNEPTGSSFNSAEEIDTFENHTVELDGSTADEYYYKLTAQETGIYRLKTTHSGATQVSYTVYDGEQSQIINGTSNSAYISFDATSGETYYVKASVSAAVDDVKFMVLSPLEYKVFVTDATTASVGSNLTVSTWPTEQSKAFKITVDQTGVYNLNRTSGTVAIGLYDDEYETVYITSTTVSSFDHDFRLSANVEYTVVLSSYYSSGNSTSISFTQKSLLSNNVASATSVSVDTSYSFSRIQGNATYYSFTVPTAGNYTVSTSGSVSGNPDLYVYDSEYNMTDSDTTSGGFAVTLGSLSAGDVVYFEVYAANSGTNSCSFSVTYTEGQMAGQTAATAINATTGTNVATGAIISTNSNNKKSKWYKFTPTQSGSYRFAFTNITGDPDVYLYSSLSNAQIGHDNKLASNTDSGSNSFNITQSLTAGTTYYIEIFGYDTGSSGNSCTMTITKQ